MAFPSWETPKDASQYSAVKLFVQSAQRARPGFELKATEAQYVARICRLVGGMPLGIVLAAAWTELLTPEEIATEITQSFDFLKTDFRDLPERQRSIRVAFEYSWRRLSEAERRVFMGLAVFRGGFTRQAAQTVTGVSLRVLAGLVNKSFVVPARDGRYDIHELLRQYAEEQLQASGQAPAVCEAHSAYYLDFLQRCEVDLAGRSQLIRLAELKADRENISIAWYWAVEVKNYVIVDQALEGLFRWYWLRRGRQQEGWVLLQFARDQWAPAPGQAPHPVWGRLLARILDQEGSFLTQPDRVRPGLEKALAIAQNHGNEAETAFCLWTIGLSYVGVSILASDYEKALTYFEQSFSSYQALNDRFYKAQVLQDMGHCYRRMWQVDRALSCLQQSLRLRNKMGDKIGQGYCLHHLGWVAFVAGNAVEAENYWQKAYALMHEIGDRQAIAGSLFSLSLLAVIQGDWTQGQRRAEEVLKMAQDIGNDLYRRWAVRVLEIAASMAATKQTAPSLSSLNTLTKFEAISCYLIFSHREDSIVKGLLHRALKEVSHDLDRVRCLPFVALNLANKGEPERATSLLALAYQFPEFATGWLEKLPMIQRLCTNLKVTLPPDIFASAWSRGQTLCLEEVVEQLLTELLETE